MKQYITFDPLSHLVCTVVDVSNPSIEVLMPKDVGIIIETDDSAQIILQTYHLSGGLLTTHFPQVPGTTWDADLLQYTFKPIEHRRALSEQVNISVKSKIYEKYPLETQLNAPYDMTTEQQKTMRSFIDGCRKLYQDSVTNLQPLTTREDLDIVFSYFMKELSQLS